MEPGEALPGRQRRRALRRRARPGRGAGLRGQARLSGGRGLREPDAPRAGDGRARARGDHDPASTAAGPPRALARRVGGTHGGRAPRPRGGSVSRVGPRPARLPAARRRSAAGGLRPGAARHRHDDDVLVVAHGGVISVYLCHLLGVSFNALWRLRIDNGSLTIAKPPRLVCVNDTAHLPPSPRSMWFDTLGVGDAPRSETPTSLWAPPTPDGDLAS